MTWGSPVNAQNLEEGHEVLQAADELQEGGAVICKATGFVPRLLPALTGERSSQSIIGLVGGAAKATQPRHFDYRRLSPPNHFAMFPLNA